MPPPDDRSALRDIQLACELVEAFVADMSREAFLGDAKTFSATQMQLATLGEAVKRLSTNFRESAPDVDWRGWAGVRDIIVHAYDIVDLDQIWLVAVEEVPVLRVTIQWLLERFDPGAESSEHS